ncbi:MAG: hypothetical protein K2N34_14855 [Lachnospiraceae bacterium]|nr:hypothetical protein [Lachnospiraceae bacterium]
MGEGTVLERLQVIISASTRPLREGLNRVNQSVRQTSNAVNNHTGRINNAFKKIGKTVVAALSIAAIVSFGKNCIELGSDLAEVQNVVDVTFGSMSEDINSFSRTALRQFGLSETSAKQYSSTMGAMLKSMGLTSDAVLDMSKNLTGLAGDMASFYNLSTDEAFAKIRSGISGETEPLKQLGINLSVANLEAYALSQGMTKSYNAMTQAEQATLRYNYLLSVTKDAQGDFARTSDSWANQTRILAESFNSVKASIGQGLINVFTPVLRVINTFVARLQVAAQVFQSFTEKIFGKSESSSSGGMPGQIAAAADSADEMSNAMSDTAVSAKEAKGALAGFDKLNNRSSDSSSAVGSSGNGASSVATGFQAAGEEAGGLVGNVNSAAQKIKSIVTSLTNWLNSKFGNSFKKILSDGKRNFNDLKKTLIRIWKDLGTLKIPLINWFTNDYVKYLNELINYVGTCLNNVGMLFNTVFSSLWDVFIFPVFQNFITVGLPLVTQFNTELLSALSVWSNEVTDIYIMLWQEGIAPVLGVIAAIWTDCINILSDTWKQYGTPIFDGIKEAIQNTSYVLQNAWEKWVKPVWDILIETLNKVWTEHMKPFVTNLVSFAAEFVDCALIIYNKFIAPIIAWIVDKLAPIVTSTFQNIVKFLGSIIGSIVDYFNGIVTSLRGIIQFIKGVFTGDWKSAWEGVKKIFSGIWDSFVSLAKGPLNLIIAIINQFVGGAESAINGLIGALNKISVKIPSWVPKYGGKEFGINLKEVDFTRVQYLAKGGIVNSATLSVIGEAGKEAVIPLENNTGWMDKLSAFITSKIDTSGIITAINSLAYKIGDGNIYITAEMDGEIVYKKMVKRNKQHKKQTGRSEFA